MVKAVRYYDSPQNRWIGVGPYYAMFPTEFADEVIKKYTTEGDYILDPFAGRGTSIYSAALNHRIGMGIEINPVGWIYSKAKLGPANLRQVIRRLKEINISAKTYGSRIKRLPTFFQLCFGNKVLRFLCSARDSMNWRRSKIDQTVAALLLVYLHGKRGASLSNQMRQTKSMAPQYSINWWQKNNLFPLEIDPLEFLLPKINWRFEQGLPNITKCYSYLGNSRFVLSKLKHSNVGKMAFGKIKLLFTSPPYCGVTNYHYDQWLRLWLLGHPYIQESDLGRNGNRFSNKESYKSLLRKVMKASAQWLSSDSVVYVRTDAREFTLRTTIEILKQEFPKKELAILNQPLNKPSQTALFGDYAQKAGDVDIVLKN